MHKQEKGLILVFRRVTKQKKKRDLREIYICSVFKLPGRVGVCLIFFFLLDVKPEKKKTERERERETCRK
jgi:hypothetical protein